MIFRIGYPNEEEADLYCAGHVRGSCFSQMVGRWNMMEHGRSRHSNPDAQNPKP